MSKRKCKESVHPQQKQTNRQPRRRTGQVQQGGQRLPQPDILTAQKRSFASSTWKSVARVRAKCPQPSLERVGQLQDQTPPDCIGSNATKGKGRKGEQRPALSLRRLNTTNGQEGSGLPGPDPPQQRQWLKPLRGRVTQHIHPGSH